MTTETRDAAMSWARYAVLLAALLGCAYSQREIFYQLDWVVGSWGLGIGALIAGWALGAPAPLGVTPAAPAEHKNTWLGLVITIVGMALAIAGTTTLVSNWTAQFGTGIGLVVGGTIVWSFGLSRIDGRFHKLPPLRWEWIEIGAFVAILALGLFLRFYRYDYFPPPDGVCAVEEPQSGQGAMMILKGSRPWEFMFDRWLPVFGMQLLGHSFTAIRVPFTIVSWLTIIPLYLLLRELVSKPAALFATLLFAFCRWHLIYARHAHAVFGPTLPLILFALYCCVRMYRRGGLALYPWIGLLSAYTLYAYAGYRATPAFIGVFFAVALLAHLWSLRSAAEPERRKLIWRSLRGEVLGGVLAVIGFVLLAVPLYHQLLLYPTYFVEAVIRAQDDPQYYGENNTRWLQQRIERIKATAMMFNHFGDGSPTFNLPGTPQLDPISGTLMAIGLAYCVIWGFYRFQGYFAFYFLLLLWIGTVFVHNFDIRRLQGIIPLIFILVAFAVDRFGKVTLARLGPWARAPLALLSVGLLGTAFADNYNLYFRKMMNDPAVRASFHNTYTVGMTYLHRMPDNGYLMIISDMMNFFTPSDFEWVRGSRVPGKSVNDLLPLLQGRPGPWTGREVHILIHRPFFEAEEIGELIEARFPTGSCATYQHPDHPAYVDFIACKIPPAATQVAEGFEGGILARYYRGPSTTPFLERREPAISYGLLPETCRVPKANDKPICRARWEGTWNVERDGDYVISADVRHGTVKLSVDGTLVKTPQRSNPDSDETATTMLSLKAGPHKIEMEAEWKNIEYIGARLREKHRFDEEETHLMMFVDPHHLVPTAPSAAEQEADPPPQPEPEPEPEPEAEAAQPS